MDGDRRQLSAKIYKFPAERWTGRRPPDEAASASRATLPGSAAGLDFGSWYHEAAIEEARRAAKK
jgi:hypothetical protein